MQTYLLVQAKITILLRVAAVSVPAVTHLKCHLASPLRSHLDNAAVIHLKCRLANPLQVHQVNPVASHLKCHLVNPLHIRQVNPVANHLKCRPANPLHSHLCSQAVSLLHTRRINPVHSHQRNPVASPHPSHQVSTGKTIYIYFLVRFSDICDCFHQFQPNYHLSPVNVSLLLGCDLCASFLFSTKYF